MCDCGGDSKEGGPPQSLPAWFTCPPSSSERSWPAPQGVDIIPITAGGRNGPAKKKKFECGQCGQKAPPKNVTPKISADCPMGKARTPGLGGKCEDAGGKSGGSIIARIKEFFGIGKDSELAEILKLGCLQDEDITHHRDVFNTHLHLRRDGYFTPILTRVDCQGCSPQPEPECSCGEGGEEADGDTEYEEDDDEEYDYDEDDEECVEDGEGECVLEESAECLDPDCKLSMSGDKNTEDDDGCKPMNNFLVRVQVPFSLNSTNEACKEIVGRLTGSVKKYPTPPPRPPKKDNIELVVKQVSVEQPTCECPPKKTKCELSTKEKIDDCKSKAPKIPTNDSCGPAPVDPCNKILSQPPNPCGVIPIPTDPCKDTPAPSPPPSTDPCIITPLPAPLPSDPCPATPPPVDPCVNTPPQNPCGPDASSEENVFIPAGICPCQPPLQESPPQPDDKKDESENCNNNRPLPKVFTTPKQNDCKFLSERELLRRPLRSIRCGCPCPCPPKSDKDKTENTCLCSNGETSVWSPPSAPKCARCGTDVRGSNEDCYFCQLTKNMRENCHEAIDREDPVVIANEWRSKLQFFQDKNCEADYDSDGSMIYKGGICMPVLHDYLWQTKKTVGGFYDRFTGEMGEDERLKAITGTNSRQEAEAALSTSEVEKPNFQGGLTCEACECFLWGKQIPEQDKPKPLERKCKKAAPPPADQCPPRK